jgi:peroxiredoxin
VRTPIPNGRGIFRAGFAARYHGVVWPRLLSLTFLFAAAGAPLSCQVRDTQGAMHAPAEWAGHPAVVLFFVTTDCPIGNSYVPEMNRLRETYAPRGVLFYAVQAEPRTADAEVARYAREYRYTFPLLLDPKQNLVKLTGATITPQAAIVSPEGKLRYLGRIDNRAVDFGVQRPRATEQDLREALDAVLAGKPVAHSFTKSIGCAIPHLE